MANQFTLGRNERIKSRKQTEEIFASGKKIHAGFLKVNYLVKEKTDVPLLFGVGVSSKTFRKATERNRLKRLIRESYRVQNLSLKEQVSTEQKQLVLFFVFTGKTIPSFDAVSENMRSILSRLVKTVIAGK